MRKRLIFRASAIKNSLIRTDKSDEMIKVQNLKWLPFVLVLAAPLLSSADGQTCPTEAPPERHALVPGEPGPIGNFHTVVDGQVYRGGAPNADGLDFLTQKFHVKTDIDLEAFRILTIQDEKHVSKKDKVKFVHAPIVSLPDAMAELAPVNDKEVENVLKIMLNSKQQPVYVHCYRGEDRTGLIIGLYLVRSGKMTPAQAYQDMLSHGFHPHFKALDDYFRKKTGYKGP